MSIPKLFKISSPSQGVLLVEMNRPPVNAFNENFWRELGSVFGSIAKDGNVRVVVLASALPKLFTAGLDLTESGVLTRTNEIQDASRRAILLRDHILNFQGAISVIEKCPQPVIGAVHGVSFGLAIDILCACDIRYAASDTRFSIKEVDVGLAADIGTLARIGKIVGNHSAIREWALTAREFGPEEAKEFGFINRTVLGHRDEVVAAALETAKLIASKSPIAVVGTKHLLAHARDHTVQDNLEYTATWNQVMLQSGDTVQAMSAFAKKQAPVFQALPKL